MVVADGFGRRLRKTGRFSVADGKTWDAWLPRIDDDASEEGDAEEVYQVAQTEEQEEKAGG